MLKSTQNVIEQLENESLPTEDRGALLVAVLDKVHALPIQNAIVISPQGIMIQGKPITQEQAINLQQSCLALNDNQAFKVIHEQVRHLAVVEGVYKGLTPEQILFSKAALWVLEQQVVLIEKIVTSAVPAKDFTA